MQLKEALSGVTGGPLEPLCLEEAALVGWGSGPGSTRSLEAFRGNGAQAWDLYSQRGLKPWDPNRLARAWADGRPHLEGHVGLYRCVALSLHKEARVAGRKECHSGGPTLCISLYNGASPPWCPGAPPPTSLVVKALSYHQQLSSFWVHSPSPSSPHQETHNWGWSAQGCDMYHAHRFHSILPSIDWPLHSPLISQSPRGPSLCLLIPLAVSGVPWVWEPLLPSSLPGALIAYCLQSSLLIYPSFLLMPYLVAQSLLPSLEAWEALHQCPSGMSQELL